MWLIGLFFMAVLAQAGEYRIESPGWLLEAQESTAEGITLQFELLDYRVLQTVEGVRVELAECVYDGAEPLPLISTWLELPAAAPVSLELLSVTSELMPGLQLAPVVESSDRLRSRTGTFERETTFTEQQWPLPVKMTTPAVMRDRRITQISIAPFRLAADGESVIRCDQIEVRISFQGEDRSNCFNVRPQQPTQVSEQLFSRLLLNYRPAYRDNRELTRGGYVLFFPEPARESLLPLISWKRQLGWEVDTVCATPAEMDAYDMKEYLQNRWDAGETFDFVLLIGDKDLYPQNIALDAFFFGGTGHSEPEWNYQNVTDHPFSLLAGDDYLPEVSVGRLSVDTIGQLQTVVNKILRYERDIYLPASDPDWPNRALMICDWWLAWSRREVMRQVRDDLLQSGYTQVDSAYSHYFNSLPVSSISDPVNEGVSYVNYRGFGHRYAWVTPYFTNDEIDGYIYNNNKLPVVTSIVCGGGDFASYGTDPCLGEKWLRHGSSNQLKGAVAFMGPSELDTHTRWNNTIDLGVYQGIVQERLQHLGQLLTRGKMELYRNNPDWLEPGGPTNSVHFYFHTYNLLGDPGLILVTGTPVSPEVLYSALIPYSYTQVPVRVIAPDVNTSACVTLYDEVTDESYSGWTDQEGLALVEIPAGEERIWTLTVSGLGLIPFQGSILQSSWQQSPLLVSLQPEEGDELVVGESQLVRLRAVNQSDAPMNPAVVTLTATGTLFGDAFQLPTIAAGVELLSENSVELTYNDPGLVLEQLLFRGEIDNSEPGAFYQLLHGRRLTIDSLLWSDDNNSYPDRGEQGSVEIFLRNSGDRGFELPASATLQLSSCLSSSTTQFDLPVLPPGAVTSCSCLLTIDTECVNGTICTLELTVTDELLWTAAATLSIGQFDWSDPAGPDAGGYYAYHSNDNYLLAPEFEWLELDPEQGGGGTELNVYDPEIAESDDPYGETYPLELPFTFRFYGIDYTSISVCSNGWLAPGTTDLTSWRNSPIPGANGPAGMVAPFWDDLCNYLYQRFGDIFYWHDQDQGRFIIEWSEFRITGAQPAMSLNFQVVIFDPLLYPTATGDSELIFHYLDYHNLDGQENYATIGIEHQTEQFGLEYCFNNDFYLPNQQLSSQQSILFTTGPVLSSTVEMEPVDAPTLCRGYPNPFNSSFNLQLTLARNSLVEVAIFNLLGERVAVLQDGWMHSGDHILQWQADSAPSGLYFYRVTTDTERLLQGKCLLIR